MFLYQLVYTSFFGEGFRLVASKQVPTEIQQAFIQNVVYKLWDTYNPPKSGYRAVYLHQVTIEHTLFGWLYNDGADEMGRNDVPYFVCYYLADLLNVVKLENIFICLQAGPLALIDRQSLSATLETIGILDLCMYDPARIGVEIPSNLRKDSHIALQQRRLIDLLVSLNEGEMVIELNEPIYKKQKDPVQPLVNATPIRQFSLSGQDDITIWRGDKSLATVGLHTSRASIPSSPKQFTLLIGIAIGVATVLPLTLIIYALFQSHYWQDSQLLKRIKTFAQESRVVLKVEATRYLAPGLEM